MLRRVQAALCGRIRRRRGHRHAAERVRPCEVDREALERESTRAASGPWTGRGGTAAIPGISSFAPSKPISAARATAGPSPSSTACATARRHETGRRRKEPAGEETLDRRCARLEMEVGDLKTNGRLGDGPLGSRRKHETAKPPRREHPLSALPELIGMPRSAYCCHEANPPSDRQATERPTIAGICEKSRFRYGYRRVADTLRKAAGIRIADKTALKAVREEGLLCRARRRRRRRFCMGRAGSTGCARPQARARADGNRPARVPQRKPPRQREGRELLLDGQDRALPRLGGTAPMSSRGIRRSISTGVATCASRDAWTEAARVECRLSRAA